MTKWRIIPTLWRTNPLEISRFHTVIPFFTASPRWRVVELDPQQVPHASLGRVVNDELIVQEGVTVPFPHPRLHSRPHWHGHTISEEKRERSTNENLKNVFKGPFWWFLHTFFYNIWFQMCLKSNLKTICDCLFGSSVKYTHCCF